MTTAIQIEELSRDEHDVRQLREISSTILPERVAKLRPGGRARWDGRGWTPLSYPGFAFQAMASATSANEATVRELVRLRDRVSASLDPGRLYPLPETSFHQTVVSTFSGERRRRYLVETGLEAEFPNLLAQVVREATPSERAEDPPVRMELVGLSAFGTAIGALGIFPVDADFQRVIGVRDSVYGHPDLRRVGLARTRPFIGHVTLCYCEAQLTAGERTQVLSIIKELNQDLRHSPLPFHMPCAALHRYEHLSSFERVGSCPPLPL